MRDSETHFSYDDEKFEAAFQAALQNKKKDHPSYIGGLKVASGHLFTPKSPIDSSIVFGTFQEPESGTAELAVEVALKNHPQWSKLSVRERAKYFESLLETVKAQRYRLAAMVLLSTGMTRQESVAEVDNLINTISSVCKNTKDGLKGKTGVWGIITSFNSPLASPIGHAVAAMAAGNTVVVMPSKYCPVPVFMIYEMLEAIGLPAGVMNLIVDRKDCSYEQLANDPELEGIVISGSAEYLEEMIFLMVDDELKVLNELKGMNPIIVHRPGDAKAAARDILESAFRYSGQGLFSTSKIIITAEDSNKIINALLEKVRELKIGDPADADTFSGPLISEESGKKFIKKTDEARGNILFGAKKVDNETTRNGLYFTPAIITGLDDDHDLMYMDSGLPILCIKTVQDFDSALQEIEETECGLSAGIISKDQRAVERFLSEADVMFKFVNESSASLKPAVYARAEAFLK
ncbi:MAG: aldehyde dehydrogenase family protein [Methanomassiliicoccaceae archaeon]|jgi:acyl-CoA reductase-like NAD-dependent aldehyde dehydrogenase|nr:aldehyde dehydrogenase family protein [Methanomassiliicoccaceae archaeon]